MRINKKVVDLDQVLTDRVNVRVVVAYFPAVFFHICNFDICHEIQHAVVTPYRAYQNDCSSFLG